VSAVPGGFLGVTLFFTLSGFLITSLLLVEHDRRGTIDAGRFWGRRIARLSPALLVVVLAVIVISATTELLATKPGSALASIWSVMNWHVITSSTPGIGSGPRLALEALSPLGPTWSLAVEEQFYALLLVVVLVASRSASPRRTLAIVAGACCVGSVVLANTVSRWVPRLEYGTDIRAGEIFVGVALAVWLDAGRRRLFTPNQGDVVAGLALAVGLGLVLWARADQTWLNRGGYLAVALVTAALICGLLAHGRVAQVVGTPALAALGRSSYSLYLVHWPVLLVLTTSRTGLSPVPNVALQIAVAVAVAVAVHVIVERPARRLRTAPWRSLVLAFFVGSVATSILAVTAL